MTERTTKAMCIKAFQRAIAAVGGEVAAGFAEPKRGGKFILSYEPANGGYQIQQYTNDKSWGIGTPFGDRRFSPAVFWDVCYQICRAAEVAESLRKE